MKSKKSKILVVNKFMSAAIITAALALGAWAQAIVFQQVDTAETSDERAGVIQSHLSKDVAKTDESVVTVPVGTNPQAVAVNPLTNKIYVANQQSGNVTVIDGTNNSTVTVAAGSGASDVAVNTVTNKIYVANIFAGTVSVIDGTTNATVTVGVGNSPKDIAINAITNKIYVANQSSNSVTVINGADNTTTAIAVGADPRTVVVNPVTNKIYVTARDSNYVTVINGETNSAKTINIETGADIASVNPVTNKIYVAGSVFVGVIDGTSDSATTFFFGSPTAIAVNPMTNLIYVNDSYGAVGIIDGADNSTKFVEFGAVPGAIALNQASNKIYIPARHQQSSSLKIIDGANNSVSNIPIGGTLPSGVAVNPVTNKIYVINSSSNDVAIIEGGDSPSAAFTVGGRVVMTDGRGIGSVSLFLMDADGRTHSARTNPFGYYRFNNIPFGTSIIGIARAKRRALFMAARQAVNITGDLENIDFTAAQ